MSEPDVRPTDCTLLIGLPLREHEFRQKLTFSESHAAMFMAGAGWGFEQAEVGWRLYERQVVQPIRRVGEIVSQLGVLVSSPTTCGTLLDALRQRRVVTVFTHFEDQLELIELDRMYPIAEACSNLPNTFGGVLDLCLCRSAAVASLFKRRLPAAEILSNADVAHPTLRAALYEKSIRLLADYPGRYTDAVADIRKRVAQL